MAFYGGLTPDNPESSSGRGTGFLNCFGAGRSLKKSFGSGVGVQHYFALIKATLYHLRIYVLSIHLVSQLGMAIAGKMPKKMPKIPKMPKKCQVASMSVRSLFAVMRYYLCLLRLKISRII